VMKEDVKHYAEKKNVLCVYERGKEGGKNGSVRREDISTSEGEAFLGEKAGNPKATTCRAGKSRIFLRGGLFPSS